MKTQNKSTYDKFIENTEQKGLLKRAYQELLLSELLHAAMKETHISVRKLAVAVKIAPTIVEALRSGEKTNITLTGLSRILDAVGYQIVSNSRYKIMIW